jgi:hypothetical protein
MALMADQGFANQKLHECWKALSLIEFFPFQYDFYPYLSRSHKYIN